jgi:hypothetical protein
MNTFVLFDRPSKSGQKLAKALGAPVVRSWKECLAVISPLTEKPVVINWGSSARKEVSTANMVGKISYLFNQPNYVAAVVDKGSFYSSHHMYMPQVLNNPQQVFECLCDKATQGFVGRKVIKGSGGKGIFFFRLLGAWDGVGNSTFQVYDFDSRSLEEISASDMVLYLDSAKQISLYEPKTYEYRLFVTPTGLIETIEKRKGVTSTENAAPELPMANWLRNHTNGYVFCKEDIEKRNPKFQAIKSFAWNNLRVIAADWNLKVVAFDVGYNKTTGKIWLYEGNTAPGLSSETTLATVVSYYKAQIAQYI